MAAGLALALALGMSGASWWPAAARAAELNVVAEDSFNRTVATGWGAADNGGNWQLNTSAGASVNGSQGKWFLPRGGIRTAMIGGSLDGAAQAQTSFSFPMLQGSGEITAGVLLRNVGAAYYEARVRVNQVGDAYLSVVANPAPGISWLLTREVPLGSIADGRKVNLVTASNLNGGGIVAAKAWVEGAAVPQDWQVSGKDDALPQAGGYGLRFSASVQTPGTDVLVDDFKLSQGLITQPPVAKFKATVNGLLVTVDGGESSDPDGTIVSYDWDFGDGTKATGVTPPPKAYSGDGTYKITLTVVDNAGATATTSQDITVVVDNIEPTAMFTYSAEENVIAFDAAGSSDPDGTIASYAWDFGDGTTGTGVAPTHTYDNAGKYQVTLTVTDNRGTQGTIAQEITVQKNQPPTASFVSVYRGLEYYFDGSGSTDPDGRITSYAWDLGDGTTATGERVVKTYEAAGTYQVTLTVTDDKGLTGSVTKEVRVEAIAAPMRGGAQLPIIYDLASLPGKQLFMAPDGDDSTGDGSEAKPFATLKKAVNVAAAGDSIVLRGGSYAIDGIISIGKPDVLITAFPGEVPVFDGSIPAPPTATVDGAVASFPYLPMPAMPGEGVSLDYTPAATFDSAGNPTGLAASRGWRCVANADYVNSGATRDEPIGMEYFDPRPGTRFVGTTPLEEASGCPSRTTPRVITGYYPDQAWVGGDRLVQVLSKSLVKPGTFYVERSADSDEQPSMSRMYISAQDAAEMSKVRVSSSNGNFLHFAADGLTLRGVEIIRHSPAWPYFALTVTEAVDRATVQDVEFNDISTIATKFAGGSAGDQSQLGNDNTMQRVTVDSPGWMGTSVMYQTGMSVLDSIYNQSNPDDEFSTAPKAGAIKLTRSDGFKLIGSELNYSGGNGLWFDQSCYGALVANNIIRYSTGSQVVYEISHGLTMVNNLILHHAPSDDNRPTVRIAGSSGTKLVNNTIVDGPVPLAFATDERGNTYTNFAGTRKCSEHTVRYREGGDFPADCPPGLNSDLDMARPGAFGSPDLTPELDWRTQADLLVNNVIANPRAGSGQVCPGGHALCANGSVGKFILPMNEIFPRGLVMDGNVYQAPNTVANIRVSSGQEGGFVAGSLAELKGAGGFGSPFYGLDVEQHGLDGAGWVTTSGQPTAALQAKQGQAAPVPTDPEINPYAQAGSRNYGYQQPANDLTGGNQYPVASFTATVSGKSVALDAAATTDPDGSIAAYIWDFGDGSPRVRGGATATHTYEAYGTYTVTLTVIDKLGAADSTAKPVEIIDPEKQFIARDAFNRTLTSGWGEASIGGAYSLSGSASNYAVDGSAGVMKLVAGQSRRAYLNSVSADATDAYAIVRYTEPLTSGGLYVSLMPRVKPDSAGYRAKAQFSADGSAVVSFSRTNSAGQETDLKSSSVRVPGVRPETKLWIRAQAVGGSPTTLRAKIWVDGTLEPANWQVETTDNTAGLQGPAGVGIFAYLSRSATAATDVKIDELAVVKPQ